MYGYGISGKKKQLVYTRNFTNRLIHWIIFFSVIVLMVTGYYIGEPVAIYGIGEPYRLFPMANIRLIHFVAAMFLDISLMVWVYLAFFSWHHKYYRELVPSIEVIKESWVVLKCYFNFKKPPFYPRFDPLDGLLFFFLNVVMVIQMLTGFQLYVMALPESYWWANIIHLTTDWVTWLFGNSQNVRIYHHLMQWIMLAGVIVHVYLQVTKTILWKDGHIGQIVGGYKYRDVD